MITAKHSNNKGDNKMTKKKILLVALAVCLIAILSMGTLAWFTDEDSVTNNFYVGNTTVDPDDVFGIDLWETADTDNNPLTPDVELGKGTKDPTGITYEEILPGQALDKNPYFTNTGIHPQYLRAIVTVTEADILKAAMTPKGSDVSMWYDVEMFLPGTGAKWSRDYTYYTNKDTFVFVYNYTEVLEPGDTTEKLFDDVVIPTELTKEQAAQMENFNITIVGQAIQSEHLADVTTAKEVFAKYWDEPGVVAGVAQSDLYKEPVAVSYPMTGDYGTVSEPLVEYDPANYTDPQYAGVLVMSDFTVEIEAGTSLVTVPATQNNVTMIIMDADYTVGVGSKIVDYPHGTGQIIISNVTINGEKITSANKAEMSQKYFSGLFLDYYG